MLLVQALDTHWSTKLTREHVMAKLKHDPQLEEDLYPVGSWRDRPPTGIANDVNPPSAPIAKTPKDDDDEDDDTPTESRLLPRALGLPAEDLELAGLGTDPRGRPACPGCQPGSNNWVVSGAHTASGKPLLANDMHLGITAPNIWYMADLKAPGYHAEGVTLPGMPFVIEGHNEHVAWGITALMGDVQDLYIEKVDGKGNYERGDAKWAPLRVDHQIIKVRFGRNVKLDVEFTDHGPLINPILHKEKRAIALKWTLYDPQLNSMPVYRVNTASNWAEFRAALADWSWPTLNIVYADDQGHIAYHAVGRIPIRNSYYRGGGYPLPFDPMNLRTEWRGAFLLSGNGYSSADYVPFDDMPNAFDPPSGFLATANARVTTEKNKYPITFEWVDPYRVERIYKALEGRGGLVPKDMLVVQTDVYSEVDQELGQRIAYAIEHTQGVDERLQQAAALLRDWDGRLTADSAAASIVTTTRKALWPMILEPKLGKAWEEYQWLEKDFAEEEIVMRAKPQWLPKNYKNWDELLTAAVRKGMDDGKAPGDVRKWAYGSWHVVDIEHPLSKFLPVVGRIAGTGEQPQTGDTTTVKQVGRAFGPSQRFTMDWSDVDGSTQNIVLGESGNPYSPYYRDQWNDWYGGTTFAFAFTDKAVAVETRHTLRLEP
jgi:penicillin amidase